MPNLDLPDGAIILTAPAGGGKTDAVLNEIKRVRAFSLFNPVWVLLATGQQIFAFQERLLARSPDSVQFGVEFFNFELLYSRLLDLLGDPQRLVEDTARYRILRHLIADLNARGDLEHFARIADTPGFVALVAGLIHELKQGIVSTDDFWQVVEPRGPKDRDLGRIYHAYQEFLRQRSLVDRHGAGWVAIDHLEGGAALPGCPDLLIVDGFDQFNQVQVRLLTALARQLERTWVTLTAVADEPGRRFHRFEQTLDRLRRAGTDPVSGRQVWQVIPLDQPPGAQVPLSNRVGEGDSGGEASEARHPVLDHLARTIFQTHPTPIPGGTAIHLIEAPDVIRETGAVLRRVKRQLLNGTPPEAITIVARDIRRYSTALRDLARAYGLPLVVREGLPLAESPVIALLLTLLDLAGLDFPRRDLLDTLRSPYLNSPDLLPEQIALLERLSLQRQIVQGRATWLDEIESAKITRADEDGEIETALDAAPLDRLAESLARHFDRITPPERGTPETLVRWIEALLGPDPESLADDARDRGEPDDQPAETADDFQVVARVRQAADPALINRDLHALRRFKSVLNSIRSAHDLISGGDDLMAWADFRAELGLAVSSARLILPGEQSRAGRVLATDVIEVRGLPHEHVYVLGLAEGVFPAQEPERALIHENERLALEAEGIDMLSAVERSDDRSLFYQVIGLARQSLTLSRFTVDDRGAECPPSAYWHAVRAAVTISPEQISHSKTGAAVGLDDAASSGEAAVALAAVFSGEHAPGDLLPAGVHGALLNADPAWANALRGRQIEAARENVGSPFDRYDGLLTDPALIVAASARVGPDRTWSASQLNDYGVCPFRFFAKRLLRLEELKEPEEGLDQRQLGSIYHAILERTYQQIAAEELTIAPENQERALAILDTQANEVFRTAPYHYGFRPSPLWDHERAGMRRRLRWLVGLDFTADSPLAEWRPGRDRVPFAQEHSFGGDRDHPALILDGEAGPLRVRGTIDRADQFEDGIVLVDYKSGSTPHPVEDMQSGRDVQMAVYLLAARALWGASVIGGLFWHIRNRKTSGDVKADDPAVTEAQTRIHYNILAARAGSFVVQPDQNRCAPFCEFRALCRLNRAHRRKAFPPSWA
jgi:ATP-dependent helicase/DNAse subunit B